MSTPVRCPHYSCGTLFLVGNRHTNTCPYREWSATRILAVTGQEALAPVQPKKAPTLLDFLNDKDT